MDTDITITAFIHGQPHIVVTRQGEYRNLMALIYDRLYPDDFGECKGTGRCGTCHVRVLNRVCESLSKEGNEMNTLSKIDVVYGNSRLACQMVVDKSLDGLQVEIISESEYPFF